MNREEFEREKRKEIISLALMFVAIPLSIVIGYWAISITVIFGLYALIHQRIRWNKWNGK